jgi:hypothetical protein
LKLPGRTPQGGVDKPVTLTSVALMPMPSSPFSSSPPTNPQRQRAGFATRAGIVFALSLLLIGQGLGLAHRVWHDQAAPQSGGGGQVSVRGDAHHAAHADAPFGGHTEGGAECRLLDQLAHADALPGSALPPAAALPAELAVSLPPPSAAGRHSAVYLARAPPRVACASPTAHSG